MQATRLGRHGSISVLASVLFLACGGGGTSSGDAGTTEDVPISSEPIVINEIAASGEPSDWIELYNPAQTATDLGGWTLTDSDPTHTHVFPGGAILGAGAYLVLLRGEAGGFSFGLGGEDSAVLYDASGSLVDRVDWIPGASPKTMSFGRIPDGQGPFVTLIQPTPASGNLANPVSECGDGHGALDEVCDLADLKGAHCEDFGRTGEGLACADSCQAYDDSACVDMSGLVVINEVSSALDDPIELFNPTGQAVDMSGWQVTDEQNAPTDGIFVLSGGTMLAPGAYMVLRKDTEHLFGLGATDEVKLRDAAGLLVDTVKWVKGEAEISFCRVPDGTGDPQPCPEASLGEPNPG